MIGELIYDWFDDQDKGVVIYSPFLTSFDSSGPLSPPTGLTVTSTGDGIQLDWQANPESDISGYMVYYDTDSGYPYEGTGANEGDSGLDAGDVTSYQRTGLVSDGLYYLTVAAYDADGNVSWYATEVVIGSQWSDATDLGGGWKYLDWFGYFRVHETSPWIYHHEHGLAYAYGEVTNDIWFYSRDNGLFWTSDEVYPWIYVSNGDVWVWDEWD
ncbi:MAG: fibronectin type III domain-containing protein [Thermodesulfobacteriota bacterium]|nr:fibronectin type III domain-containing protein [Thermodesulfobacteriota bacterium]